MLIIAIGHGSTSDEYSCSAIDDTSDPKDMQQVLASICAKQNLHKENIDELICVKNDEVIAHYTWENGLGV